MMRTLFLCCLYLWACARARDPEPQENDRTVPATNSTAAPTTSGSAAKPPLESEPLPPIATTSLYDLDVPLTDESGQLRGLNEFRGKLVLVAMFYATCTSACPMLIKDLKDLLAALSPDQRTNVRVLLISFDPTRDTPQKRAELRALHELDPTIWRVAAALPSNVRELAAVLGLRYRSMDDGEFFHTSLITLLDDQGVPLARVEGLGRDGTSIIDAIETWQQKREQ